MLCLGRLGDDNFMTMKFLRPLVLVLVVQAAALAQTPDIGRLAIGGVRSAEVVERVEPRYSDTARSLEIEGVVWIQARIKLDGSVDVLRVVDGLGYGLDTNALIAIQHWRFRPGTKDGVPAEMIQNIPVEFSLENAETEETDQAIRPWSGAGGSPWMLNGRASRGSGGRQLMAEARRAGLSDAEIILEMTIGLDGLPQVRRIVKSAGSLDQTAVDYATQWRFRPMVKEGTPVEVRFEVQFKVSLEERRMSVSFLR